LADDVRGDEGIALLREIRSGGAADVTAIATGIEPADHFLIGDDRRCWHLRLVVATRAAAAMPAISAAVVVVVPVVVVLPFVPIVVVVVLVLRVGPLVVLMLVLTLMLMWLLP
jgi:hypothetical protein